MTNHVLIQLIAALRPKALYITTAQKAPPLGLPLHAHHVLIHPCINFFTGNLSQYTKHLMFCSWSSPHLLISLQTFPDLPASLPRRCFLPFGHCMHCNFFFSYFVCLYWSSHVKFGTACIPGATAAVTLIFLFAVTAYMASCHTKTEFKSGDETLLLLYMHGRTDKIKSQCCCLIFPQRSFPLTSDVSDWISHWQIQTEGVPLQLLLLLNLAELAVFIESEFSGPYPLEPRSVIFFRILVYGQFCPNCAYTMQAMHRFR